MKNILIILGILSFSSAFAEEESTTATAKAMVTAQVINPITLNKDFLENKNILIHKTIYTENGFSKIIINFE